MSRFVRVLVGTLLIALMFLPFFAFWLTMPVAEPVAARNRPHRPVTSAHVAPSLSRGTSKAAVASGRTSRTTRTKRAHRVDNDRTLCPSAAPHRVLERFAWREVARSDSLVSGRSAPVSDPLAHRLYIHLSRNQVHDGARTRAGV